MFLQIFKRSNAIVYFIQLPFNANVLSDQIDTYIFARNQSEFLYIIKLTCIFQGNAFVGQHIWFFGDRSSSFSSTPSHYMTSYGRQGFTIHRRHVAPPHKIPIMRKAFPYIFIAHLYCDKNISCDNKMLYGIMVLVTTNAYVILKITKTMEFAACKVNIYIGPTNDRQGIKGTECSFFHWSKVSCTVRQPN